MRKFLLLFLLFVVFVAHGQREKRIVQGHLTDPADGVPLPGVNVVIKGTSIGTTTDVNGFYQLEAELGSVIVFSFVGYSTREIIVTEANSFPIGGQKSDTLSVVREKVFRHSIPDDPEKTFSPYFFIKSDDPVADQMPLKSTSASVSIAGIIADVTVRQVYVNTGKSALEAVYIFPGSTRAAVYAMSMSIGNRRLTAKIREKQKARIEYETAKAEGKSATLLEQHRPNVFQMNVANILPGDTISVELKYTEALIPLNGTYEFVYPTVVGPRYSTTPDDEEHASEKWVESPYHQEGESPSYTFKLNTLLNSGIPVQKIASPSHNVKVHYESKERVRVELDSTELLGGNRDFILRYRLRGGQVESGMLLNPRADENFFLLMVEPPDAPTLDQIPPREYIFIVDVSGSMRGFPIEVSKRLLRNLIGNLRPTDRFNVMLFESSNAMLHKRSVEATEVNIREAISVMDQQVGGGGTELYPALRNALSFPKEEEFSRTFIVVTDGYVNIEKEAFNLVRNNLAQANLFAFGIGSSVNRFLIEGLAHAGMGEPFIVTNNAEAETVGKKFREFVEQPVLTNIQVSWGDFDVYDIEPVSIPDVFAQRPIMIYGKYKGRPEGTIRISGYSGARLWEKKINLKDATDENNDALRYLWARNKIRYIDDYARYYEDPYPQPGADHSESRAKLVTELGLKYNLLTQYTSFIAVDSVVRNKTGESDKVVQPLPLPAGVSNNAIASLAGVTLSPDVQSLTEVVVVGYGVQRRQDVTACITSVESYDVSAASSVPQALNGRVSGVIVYNNNSSPGNSSSVRIRGNHSVVNNNSPLYVVDGVVVDDTEVPAGMAGASSTDRLSGINPSDIESIQVLKGPAATAIYGSRGASGVIVISTNKSLSPRKQLDVVSSFSLSTVNKLPKRQNTFSQGAPQDGTATWRGPDTGETFSWGPPISSLWFDGSAYHYDKHGRLTNTPTGMPARSYDPYTFFTNGVKFSNSIRFGSSAGKVKYDLTLRHEKGSGVVPGTSDRQISFRTDLSKQWSKITIGFNGQFSQQEQTLAFQGNLGSSVMYSLLTTPPSFDIGNGRSGSSALDDESAFITPDGSQRTYSPGVVDNPYWTVHHNGMTSQVRHAAPSLKMSYELSRGLRLRTRVSGEFYDDNRLSGFDKGSSTAISGAFYDRREEFRSMQYEAMLETDHSLFDHSIRLEGNAGFHSTNIDRSVLGLQGLDLKDEGAFSANNASVVQRTLLNFDQYNHRGLGRIHINVKEYFSLDVSGSLENTSTLNDPIHSESIGTAFKFSELPFNQYSNIFSFGKLHASIGRSEVEAPLFIDRNNIIRSISNQSTSTAWPERIRYVRGDLNPEAVVAREAGLSVEFINSRIALDLSTATSTTYNAYAPLFDEVNPSLINGATIRNRTAEFSLRTRPVEKELSWSFNVTYTRIRSRVLSLNDHFDRIPLAGFEEASSNLVEGQPYGVLVGTRWLRNSNNEIVVGADGFPMVDPVMGVIGDPNPDWTMGIENALKWNSLRLTLLFDIRKGGDIWNGTRNTMNYFGTGKDSGDQRGVTNFVFDGVTTEGEPNSLPVSFADPAAGLASNRWVRYGRAGVAEEAIEDGSWFRCREVSVACQLPGKFTRRLRIKRTEVSATAHNLFVITPYSGVDPDTNLTGNSNGRGLDYFNLPGIKSYSIALKVGF
jgi:TonB-linked SusC/RagA family outer membrane protein